MNIRPLPSALRAIGVWCGALGLIGLAQDGSSVPAAAVDPRGDEEIRIREIFASHLPNTLKENALRLWVHPHLGDFSLRDYLRISTGVRYGLTPKWEIGAGTDLYFSHGFGDVGFFKQSGAANLQFGTKLNLGQGLLPGWNTAVGADVNSPAGRPPSELTDGLRHYSPFATFSRRLESRPEVRVFWGLGVDLVERTNVVGEFRKNQLDDSSVSASAGFVLDRGRLHYTFEASVATTRLAGSTNEDVLTLRPGVIWEVPTRHETPGKSNWMVGAALRTSFGPDGTDFGGSVKLRYNLDLKRLFRASPAR